MVTRYEHRLLQGYYYIKIATENIARTNGIFEGMKVKGKELPDNGGVHKFFPVPFVCIMCFSSTIDRSS